MCDRRAEQVGQAGSVQRWFAPLPHDHSLQLGAVRRAVVRGVEALTEGGQGAAGRRPTLRRRAVAVVDLHLRAVGRAGARHVEALAERPDGAIAADGPALRGRAVAGVQLYLGAVGGVGAGDVDALAADPDDLALAGRRGGAGVRPDVGADRLGGQRAGDLLVADPQRERLGRGRSG